MVTGTRGEIKPAVRKLRSWGKWRGSAHVARELGLSKCHVWMVLDGERGQIGTAPAIRAAYEQWLKKHGGAQ